MHISTSISQCTALWGLKIFFTKLPSAMGKPQTFWRNNCQANTGNSQFLSGLNQIYIHIPSTLNIDLILWHTLSIVFVVKGLSSKPSGNCSVVPNLCFFELETSNCSYFLILLISFNYAKFQQD